MKNMVLKKSPDNHRKNSILEILIKTQQENLLNSTGILGNSNLAYINSDARES